MSKVFVHTLAVVVANNVLINSFDLRRRDVDDATAFAYFAKAQQNYVDVVVSDVELDATFFHNVEKTTFTRLVVRSQEDVVTCCERCAAQRGDAHESYCDVSKQESAVIVSAASVEKKTALSVLSKLTLKSAVSTSVKASAASEDAQESAASEDAKSEDAQESEESEESEDAQKESAKSVREKLKSAAKAK